MSLDPALEHETRVFAESTNALLADVFDAHVDPIAVLRAGDRLSVTTADARGLLLTANDAPALRLKVRYDCDWDSAGQFLAVDRSEFHVLDASGTGPLVRYEFVRRPSGSVPAAHLQVHGESAALAHALAARGSSTRRSRAAAARQRPARLPDLHLPVGGRRFRPALEDVIELIVDECGLDVADRWRDVLGAGRERWRRLQTRTVVRDDPETAAELLRSLGYNVRRPLDGAPTTNVSALREA